MRQHCKKGAFGAADIQSSDYMCNRKRFNLMLRCLSEFHLLRRDALLNYPLPRIGGFHSRELDYPFRIDCEVIFHAANLSRRLTDNHGYGFEPVTNEIPRTEPDKIISTVRHSVHTTRFQV